MQCRPNADVDAGAIANAMQFIAIRCNAMLSMQCNAYGHFGSMPKVRRGCEAPPAMARYDKQN
eukprot:611752-Lingulodinium_polyedra.AAC.1